MQAIQYITTIGAALIVLLCIQSYAAMGPGTKHCFRIVYGVIGVAALGLCIVPFAKGEYIWMRPWFGCAFTFGIVGYMALDRRRLKKGY